MSHIQKLFIIILTGLSEIGTAEVGKMSSLECIVVADLAFSLSLRTAIIDRSASSGLGLSDAGTGICKGAMNVCKKNN
jgi:hypothetical protein